MKKILKTLSILSIFVLSLTGCNNNGVLFDETESKIDIIKAGVEPEDVKAWEAEVDSDFQLVLESIGTENEIAALGWFDNKYGTNLKEEFGTYAEARSGSSSKSGTSNYPLMKDMPFNVDGAVYISGGTDDLVGTVIDWVSPKTLPGSYYHGAVLDLDKYDPNDETVYCLETAISRGAGYETATNWRGKVNACVLNPKTTLTKSRIDNAQAWVDNYCRMDKDITNYGFFKGAINIFDIVTKEDMKTWYCTKVVWWVYNQYGWDIDSNSNLVDFTTSGLYTLVKDFYSVRYFYSSSKKNNAINDYIATAKKDIVLAEEIVLSPYFNKVYENIREN